MGEDLILATMPTIPKYEVEEVLGVIYGSSTRTRGLHACKLDRFYSMYTQR